MLPNALGEDARTSIMMMMRYHHMPHSIIDRMWHEMMRYHHMPHSIIDRIGQT